MRFIKEPAFFVAVYVADSLSGLRRITEMIIANTTPAAAAKKYETLRYVSLVTIAS